MTKTTRAGVILSDGRTLFLVPSRHSRYVVPSVKVTEVPGSQLGLALVDGDVLSVCRVGRRKEHLLVCELDRQLVALSGVSVLMSGQWTDEELLAHGVDPRALGELDVAACFRTAVEPHEPSVSPGDPP